MDFGNWTEERKGSYNNWDAIARSTIEVYSHLQCVSLDISFGCLLCFCFDVTFRFTQGHGLLYLCHSIMPEFGISELRILTDGILVKKHTSES